MFLFHSGKNKAGKHGGGISPVRVLELNYDVIITSDSSCTSRDVETRGCSHTSANWTVFRVVLRLFVITSQVCDFSFLHIYSRTHTCTFCNVSLMII